MEWKKLLTVFLCVIVLALNTASVLAEDTDAGSPAVSGNDISVNDESSKSEEETDKKEGGGTGEDKEPENSTGCGHEYRYTPGYDGTHTAVCINCGLEETENCILTEKAEDGQACEKCGFIAETGENTAIEDDIATGDLPLLFSIETGGYDVLAADRTYTAGENITAYYFEADGTLLFEGTGPMAEWESDHDVPWNSETVNTAIVGEGITTLGAYALSFHQELATLALPGTLKAIGDYAVCETYPLSGTKGKLREIEIPDGVERIGEFAFRGNALEAIRIPDSVTEVGGSAFAECRAAGSLSIGSGLSEIKERTFSELQSVKTIRIPGNVEDIQTMAFRKPGASEIIISDGVKAIGERAFEDCENAGAVTLGNSVEVIGGSAFSGCRKLKTLTVPDSVATIGSNAFMSCSSLSELTLGSGLLAILNHAFEGAHALERLEIPDNVTQIGSSAFRDSRALKDISIGSGITKLGYGVFFIEDMIKTNVATGNKTALNYDWAGDEREAAFQSKIVFKDHLGNSVKEMLLAHGDTVMDKAPVMEGYEEDGDTYVFTGWEPEITEDTKVTGGAEYTAKYSIPGKGTVTFKNYDGTVLKKLLLSYGDTILDKAPQASREAEGRNAYLFSGWLPALGEADELTGDAVYTAAYQRKTQTGIQVSYDDNIPEGSSISDANFAVYPVYSVYDENNKLIEMIWDDKAVIGKEDLRFSGDRIERGSNEIIIEQISTGLSITAEIFGSYIDGITVWQPPKELEAGTELKELEVYFTRTIEDKAGYIENGVIDDPSKKVEEYKLNEKDSVTIEEGDNEIRVTEKESGEEHECTIHIKGIPKPSDGKDDVSGNNPPDDKKDDVSGNNPSDDKKDDVSGNNPPDDKKDEVSGNNPPDDKKDEVSGNNPINDKKEDVSGKKDADGNDKKPGKEDKGKGSGGSPGSGNNNDSAGDNSGGILPEMENKKKEAEPVIQTGRVSPVYGLAVLGLCGILLMGSGFLPEKRKRAGKLSSLF